MNFKDFSRWIAGIRKMSQQKLPPWSNNPSHWFYRGKETVTNARYSTLRMLDKEPHYLLQVQQCMGVFQKKPLVFIPARWRKSFFDLMLQPNRTPVLEIFYLYLLAKFAKWCRALPLSRPGASRGMKRLARAAKTLSTDDDPASVPFAL